MKKLLIYFFLSIFLLLSVQGVLNYVSYTESWSLMDGEEYSKNDVTKQDIENISLTTTTGDMGKWHIGKMTPYQNQDDIVRFDTINGDTRLFGSTLDNVVMTHYLDDTLFFNELAEISFTYNISSLIDSGNVGFLCVGWKYLNDTCKGICNDGTNNILRNNYCAGNMPVIIENNTKMNYTLNGQKKSIHLDLLAFENETQGIEEIFFSVRSYYTAGSNVSIWDLNFTNFLNGTNQMPSLNLTVNSSYVCIEMNDTFPVTINLDIDVSDYENDVIYYGETFSEINTSYFLDFTKYNANRLYGIQADFYEFEDNFESGCDISGASTDTTNEANHRLLKDIDAVGDETYVIDFNGDCTTTTNRDLINIFKTNSFSFNYEVELSDLDDLEEFNMSIVGEKLDKSDNDMKLLFVVNNTNVTMTVLSSNGTKQEIFNKDMNWDSFRLKIYNTYSLPNHYGFMLTRSSNGLAYDTIEYYTYISPANYGEYSGIVYEILPTNHIYINYVLNTLTHTTLGWTTDKPTTITFNQPIFYHYLLYYSDDAHYPEEYYIKDMWFRVEQKKYCIDQESAKDIKANIERLIGNDFRGYFDYIGERDKAIKFVHFLFFGLVIFFNVSIYLSSRQFAVLMPVLISSIICFGFSMLLQAPLLMVEFMILFALSFGGLIYLSRK